MKWRTSWKVLLFWLLVLFGIFGLETVWFIVVMNADLYGRLTETQSLGQLTVRQQPAGIPTVRLVIHRVLADENAVEASIVAEADNRVVTDSYWRDVKGLIAGVQDASTFQSVYLTSSVNVSLEPRNPGATGIALRSERFQIPSSPSMVGFPFDDLRLFVMPYLRDSAGYIYPFKFEVQKALPGRLLSVSGEPLNAQVRLSRSSTEIALVMVGGMVFILLSLSVATLLLRSSSGFKSWEELLAFAGYLVGATAFREMLGVSRATGTSAFEVAVFGVPMLALTTVMLVALFRNLRPTREKGERD